MLYYSVDTENKIVPSVENNTEMWLSFGFHFQPFEEKLVYFDFVWRGA